MLTLGVLYFLKFMAGWVWAASEETGEWLPRLNLKFADFPAWLLPYLRSHHRDTELRAPPNGPWGLPGLLLSPAPTPTISIPCTFISFLLL